MAKSVRPKISSAMVQTMDGIMGSGRKGVVYDQGAMYGTGMDAAGAASGMAFLVGELEKQDTRLLEPMTSITAPRDIIMKAGGGWVTQTSNVYVDYATTSNDEDSIITGGETTDIPVTQANLSKDVFKVFTFAEILRAPLFDDLKLQQIGKSLTTILDDGLRLNFNKILDRNVYVGISKTGTFGLVNNPLVTAGSVVAGVSTFLTWAKKTAVEILNDVNSIINATWIASEYDLSGMANQILIDPSNYAFIANTPISLLGLNGATSLLDYLLKNNIAVNQGRGLKIFPSRWCIGAGVGATQRMVAYVNEENRLNMDLTVPLSRVLTAPNVQSASYETLYAAQIGQVKVLYTQCIRYADGI
jgi:hypothetical protein